MAAALVAAILFVHGRGGGGLHARSSGPDPGRIYYDERAIHFDAQGFGDLVPKVGEVASFRIEAKALLDLPAAMIRVRLDEGAKVVGGTLAYDGPLGLDPVILKADILVNKAGDHTFRLYARAPEDQNLHTTVEDYHFYSLQEEAGPGHLPAEFPTFTRTTIIEPGYLPGQEDDHNIPEIQTDPPDPTVEPPICQEDELPGEDASGSADSSARSTTMTVTGYLYYYDRSDSLEPVQHGLVQLRKKTGGHLGFDYTDHSGYFSVTGTCSSCSKAKLRFWSYAYPNGNELLVLPSGSQWDDTFHATTDSFDMINGTYNSGSWSIENNVSESNQNEDSFWIHQDLVAGHHFLLGETSDGVGDVTVKWEHNSTDGSYYTHGGKIRLTGTAAEDTNDTVLHEMGHNVMYNYWGADFPSNDCPDPHYFQQAGGEHCGWTEGWAHIWHFMVNDDAVRNYPGGGSINTEPYGGGWDDGSWVEGRVAGAWWDLVDTNVDGVDTYTDSFSYLWDLWKNHHEENFVDFFDVYSISGLADVCLAKDVAVQNTIEVTFCPSCRISPAGGGIRSLGLFSILFLSLLA